MTTRIDELLPEWPAFREAVTTRRPDHGTACSAWTVRDIVAHNAGNAEELGRVLSAHLEGGPVPRTRSFEEREPKFRSLADDELIRALDQEIDRLAAVLEEAERSDPDEFVAWTGREMKTSWFGEHMREELVIHRWDVVGDDPTSQELLAQPWLTEHSVVAVGAPLLRKGASALEQDEKFDARLRAPDRRDVIVTVGRPATAITLGPVEGPAVIESDPGSRVLLLWGRQPSDPARLASRAGPSVLGRIRALLAGY